MNRKLYRRMHPQMKNSKSFNDINNLPERKGCYAIINKITHRVSYVGASENLRKRLKSHSNTNYQNWYNGNYTDDWPYRIFYWLDSNPFSLERKLISFLQPENNIHFSSEMRKAKQVWSGIYREKL